MTSRYRRKPVDIPRFSSLEIAAMQALAWELQSTVSDLDAQFELASAGRRINTGSGFHHEIIIDRNRKAPRETATGLFGTVHALIDGLEDAVLFQVQLREGRLLALVADAYDQDTRDIDFMTAGYEQVFYLDADGASVPFEGSVLLSGNRPAWERPVWERSDWEPPAFQTGPPVIAAVSPASRPRAIERAALHGSSTGFESAAVDLVDDLRTLVRPRAEPAGAPMDPTTLKVGIWVGLIALAAIAVALGSSFFFTLFGAVFIARAATQKPALDAIGRMLADRRWRPEG